MVASRKADGLQGQRLLVVLPVDPAGAPLFLFSHGNSQSSDQYDVLFESVVALGFVVVSVEIGDATPQARANSLACAAEWVKRTYEQALRCELVIGAPGRTFSGNSGAGAVVVWKGTPDGVGSAPSNVRDQMTYPVSLSSKYSLLELPATIDAGTKSVTPLAVTPCVRPCCPRRGLSSFDVHCNSNPGFDSDSTEMFGSVWSHEVR